MKKSIIRLTIKNLFRKKAWSLMIFFILSEMIIWTYLKTLTEGIVMELFLQISLSVFSILMTTSIMLSSISEVRNEIRDNTIYMILGKGITRLHYYVSKAFSVWLFYFPICILSILTLEIIELFYDISIFSFWISIYVLLSKTLVWSFVFCAIALFSDYIIAISLSALLWVASLLLPVGAGFIIPATVIFDDIIRADLMNQNIPFWYFFFVLVYAFIYILLITLITRFFFSRKEI